MDKSGELVEPKRTGDDPGYLLPLDAPGAAVLLR